MTNSQGNIVPLPNTEAIEAEAAAWVTALQREQPTHEDLADFRRWLSASERHRAAFEQFSALWRELGGLTALNDIAAEGEVAPTTRSIARRRLAALAASFAAVAILGAGFYALQMQGRVQSGVYETAIGEQRTIELADGSAIQLNTNSRAEVSYSRRDREIRLIRGEAHFDVARNKRRPFSVYAADGVIRAVGTAFTVRLRDENAVEVTVEEGRVALSSHAVDAATGDDTSTRAPIAQLTAGQNALFGDRIEEIAQMPEPELKRKLAWRQGMLVYSGEPLSAVIADVARYTDVTIEIADPGLAEKPVAGYFRVGEMEGLFDSLQLSFGIRVERVSESYIRLTASS